MYEQLTSVIAETNLWQGSRQHTHSFLLSPDIFRLSEQQHRELKQLGFALYDCLLGLSHIATIAFDTQLNYRGAWGLIRKIFSTGIPTHYQRLQGMNVKHIPRLLKVDLMLDQESNFKIAEIDGHNKHGIGYSTLALRFRQRLYPDSRALPGTVKILSEDITRSGKTDLIILYSDQERFYLPEMEITQSEFAANGIDCQLLTELSVEPEKLKGKLLLDLPFLYLRSGLYDELITLYEQGEMSFIIPPKPFLGAKGVLALLRNDTGFDQLEAILKSFIREESLTLVRAYLPETYLVGKQAADLPQATKLSQTKKYVLKESISSGMKGTIFSDEKNFPDLLLKACRTNLNWILQAEVANQPQTFSWYEINGSTPRLRTADDWYMRITTHYINRTLSDVIVTARRDKAVHGAKDCLQIGTIIE